ncbi:MAG: AAA family ATPase [Planctomycetota bacterium]
MTKTLTDAAIKAANAGLSIVPVGQDKRPIGAWKQRQTTPANAATLQHQLADNRATGVAAICGRVSGGLEVIDFDVPGFYERWAELAADVLHRLPVQRTGGGGHQVAWRRPTPGGNQKLAWSPNENEHTGREVAIETRGEGGYVVIPPSLHPSGKRYAWATPETFASAPILTDAEAEVLLDAARSLCKAPHTRQELEARRTAQANAKPRQRASVNGEASVIDTFNKAVTIREMLTRAGYTLDTRSGEYTRPGEGASPGGVVILDGRSFHHSTNDPLHDGLHTVDSFAVFCAIEHGGELPKAIRAAAIELGIEHKAEEWPGPAPRKTAEPEKTKIRSFIMRSGSSIDDDGIQYLVKRRWIMGSLNILFSRPGRGKSTIAASVAGFVTTGRTWPDGNAVPRGAVLYLKGEGSDASIRDRLKLAGADLDNVFIVGRADTADDDESPMIDLANDHAALMRAVQACEEQCGEAVRLIIVDTLDSMFPSMRMIDNANIRKCLWPIQELAEQTGICALILAHTNKGGYADPLDRLSGGRAIGGAARSVWYLGKLDPEADECYLASVKANDYLPAPSMKYEIVGINPDSPGAIRWGDVSEDVSAWDLDQPPKSDKGSKAEECAEWMAGLLATAPMRLSEVKTEAAKHDYGDRVFKKARDANNAVSKPQKGTFPPVFWLCLDGQTPPEVEAKV